MNIKSFESPIALGESIRYSERALLDDSTNNSRVTPTTTQVKKPEKLSSASGSTDNYKKNIENTINTSKQTKSCTSATDSTKTTYTNNPAITTQQHGTSRSSSSVTTDHISVTAKSKETITSIETTKPETMDYLQNTSLTTSSSKKATTATTCMN